MTMILRIGNRLTVNVLDFAHASEIYADERDGSGEGGSTFPFGKIVEGGKIVAYVSYNAKVWADDPCRRDWEPGVDVPLYSPYAAQVAA